MTFAVAADSYDRFMGRYSVLLAPQLAALADVAAGQRARRRLRPGCADHGARAARRAGGVTAVDPSEPFVAAARAASWRHGRAGCSGGACRFDDSFDAALGAARRPFHDRPRRGAAGDGAGHARRQRRCRLRLGLRRRNEPAEHFWDAAREKLDPDVYDESGLPGARCRAPVGVVRGGGASPRRQSAALEVTIEHPSFEDWWEPFTLGVGPAGAYAAGLEPERQAELQNAAPLYSRASVRADRARLGGARARVSSPETATPHVGESSALRLVGLGALIGIPAALVAALFLAAVHKIEHWLWVDSSEHLGVEAALVPRRRPAARRPTLIVLAARTLLPGDGGHEPLGGIAVAPTPIARSGRHTRGDRLAGVRRRARSRGSALRPRSVVGLVAARFARWGRRMEGALDRRDVLRDLGLFGGRSPPPCCCSRRASDSRPR